MEFEGAVVVRKNKKKHAVASTKRTRKGRVELLAPSEERGQLKGGGKRVELATYSVGWEAKALPFTPLGTCPPAMRATALRVLTVRREGKREGRRRELKASGARARERRFPSEGGEQLTRFKRHAIALEASRRQEAERRPTPRLRSSGFAVRRGLMLSQIGL